MDLKAEVKREYTIQLVNILTPHIYNNIKSIYNDASKIAEKDAEMQTFQIFLRKINDWPSSTIKAIIKSIQDSLNNEIDLNDLVRAVIKANIDVYISSSKKTVLEYTIELDSFIKAIYKQCAEAFYEYPFVFYHKMSQFELKRNQKEIKTMIKDSIENAIRNMLPLNFLTKEYLKPVTESIKKTTTTTEHNSSIKLEPNEENAKDRLKHMLSESLKNDKANKTYSLSVDKNKVVSEKTPDKQIKLDERKSRTDDCKTNSQSLNKKCEEEKKNMPDNFAKKEQQIESESYIPAAAHESVVEAYTTKVDKTNPRSIANKVLKNELTNTSASGTEIIDRSVDHMSGSYKIPQSLIGPKIVTNEINI